MYLIKIHTLSEIFFTWNLKCYVYVLSVKINMWNLHIICILISYPSVSVVYAYIDIQFMRMRLIPFSCVHLHRQCCSLQNDSQCSDKGCMTCLYVLYGNHADTESDLNNWIQSDPYVWKWLSYQFDGVINSLPWSYRRSGPDDRSRIRSPNPNSKPQSLLSLNNIWA